MRTETLRMHSPGGSTFLREMTSWSPFWACGVKSKIRLRQSMSILFTQRTFLVKFHPDPILNDGAIGIFEDEEAARQQEQQEQDG